MKPLQVLGNQKCRTTILTLTCMRNSLELLATARVEHVYINIKQFHVFVEFSVISVHRKYSSEKKRKKKELLARFELPSSVIRVLDLAHYTTANDMVNLLPL